MRYLIFPILLLTVLSLTACNSNQSNRSETSMATSKQSNTNFTEQDKATLYTEVEKVNASSLTEQEKKAKKDALFNDAFEKVRQENRSKGK